MSLWLNFASLPVGRQGYVQNDILVVFNWAKVLKNQWHFQQFLQQPFSLTERYGYVGEKTTRTATLACAAFVELTMDS